MIAKTEREEQDAQALVTGTCTQDRMPEDVFTGTHACILCRCPIPM
jgi:hypothetical protein